jgi:chorismate mutase
MSEIDALREKIDAVDEQILCDLLERVKIARAIGELKKREGRPVQDSHRESQVFERARERAERLKLDPERIERIYREIVNMCSTVQQ